MIRYAVAPTTYVPYVKVGMDYEVFDTKGNDIVALTTDKGLAERLALFLNSNPDEDVQA